jgi:ferrous iron transport protein A
MSATLADLEPGQSAIVTGFHEHSPLTQRIMQMGILEGSGVEVVRRAPAGDPIELKVLGYAISLRRNEAALIAVGDVN